MNARICIRCKCLSCSNCGCKKFSESKREFEKRLEKIPPERRCISCEVCIKNGCDQAKGKCITYNEMKGDEVMEMSKIETNPTYKAVEKCKGHEFAVRVGRLVEMGGFSIVDAAEFLSQWDEVVARLRRSGADLSRIRLKGKV